MTRLALSFDNGPDPAVTPQVLALLAERDLKASFFVLGKNLESPAGKELVRAAYAAGHAIGNHSYSHGVPLGEDPRADAVEREIVATELLLAPLVPGAPRAFRPFGGGGVLGPHLLQPAAVRYLQEHEYSCVLWNSVPRDWDDPTGWVPRALSDLDRSEHVSMVLHDVPGAALELLSVFLDAVRARGVELVLEQPDDCLPIRDGEPRGDLSAITGSDLRAKLGWA